MITSQFYIAGLLTLFFSIGIAFYYYQKFFRRDLAMSIVVFSLLIFCIVYFVSFENNLGLGIGLLGILSIIRLRSTPENLTDISFIFYSISLGLLNASISDLQPLFIVDLILTLLLILLSSSFFFKKNLVQTQIVFDEIFFDKLNNKNLLKKEIKKKYHVDAVDIRVNKIDYLKDSVILDIFYYAENY